MTYSTQPHSGCTIEKTNEKTNKKNLPENLSETTEIICEMLSVCDSLNKLYESLSRLGYAINKKVIENLIKKNQGGILKAQMLS